MREVYLTIDDSPSPFSKDLGQFLLERNVPALFFCRGDTLEKYEEGAVALAEMDFVLGNHAYSHTRFSEMSYEACIAEIEKTEKMIEDVYKQVGKTQSVKTLRFPHMDRGAGGWIVNYDALPEEHRDFVIALFADGVRINLDPPSNENVEKKNKIQDYLKREGYVQPFEKITFPWFQDTEMNEAADCLYTFSTSDWMLLDRHRGKWKYASMGDLKAKMDDDKAFQSQASRHIVLAHDKPEPEIYPVVTELVDYMLETGVKFVSV